MGGGDDGGAHTNRGEYGTGPRMVPQEVVNAEAEDRSVASVVDRKLEVRAVQRLVYCLLSAIHGQSRWSNCQFVRYP